jgi:hypothetical protein
MRVIIRGNWANFVGTDYCDVLGIYDDLDGAADDARDYAYDTWEPQSQDCDEQESGIEFEDGGPDYWLEEYDASVHDDYRAGGGSFMEEFERIENA